MNTSPLSLNRMVLVGLLGLASAMGIGRFAFTPILPLMQQEGAITLLQGSWLASINYLGYFVGALICTRFLAQPGQWASKGLALVALVTLAMAWPAQSMMWWLLWRFLAGVASAFVLVGISAWCFDALARHQQQAKAGWVYAGVGTGIALAGLLALLVSQYRLSASVCWLALGGIALLVAAFCGRHLGQPDTASPNISSDNITLTRHHGLLIVCYTLFGIGYILPATFLPAQAKTLFSTGIAFAWVWPVFGLAAALSTLFVSRFFARFSPIGVWAAASLVLTLGVLLPLLSTQLATLLLSAICVGGTFMVITQAGLQAAKRLGGARLIAAMTAGFAAGQMLGPLLLHLSQGSFAGPSLFAATLLLGAAVLLWSLDHKTNLAKAPH